MGKGKYLNLVITIGITVLISGCLDKPDTEVPPERIFTTYSLIYEEETNRTIADAIFTADDPYGWRQELKGIAKIDFEGEELELYEAVDEYVFVFDQFLTLGDFHYTDQNGNTYVNSAEVQTIGYPSGLDTLEISQDYVFEWVGDPVKEGEIVSINFEEESLGVVSTYKQEKEGAASISVPKEDLNKLDLGDMKLRLIWEKKVSNSSRSGSWRRWGNPFCSLS